MAIDSLVPGEIILEDEDLGPRADELYAQGYYLEEAFAQIKNESPYPWLAGNTTYVWMQPNSVPDNTEALIVVAKEALRALNVKWSWDFWDVCQVRQKCPVAMHAYNIVEPLLKKEFMKCFADSKHAVLSKDELLKQWFPLRQTMEQQYLSNYKQATTILKGISLYRQSLSLEEEYDGCPPERVVSLRAKAVRSVRLCQHLEVIDGWLLD